MLKNKSRLKKSNNDASFVRSRCPLCNSDNKQAVYPDKYQRLNKCLICHLFYTSPRLSKKGINKLYDSTYFSNSISHHFGYSDYLADEHIIRKTFQRRLRDIDLFFTKKGNLLDLGCAAGFFIDEAQKIGWNAKGVELSSFIANYGSKKLNLNIVNTDIEEYHFEKNTYDLITMWDTIEHLTDPLDILKQINRSLKKDGLVIFSTPDVGSMPAKIFGSSWIGYKLSDEHLTYFSKDTIKKICLQAGFTIEKMQYQGKFVSQSLFIDRMRVYNNYIADGIDRMKIFLPKEFYVNPYDIICVYAKKK